MTHTNGLPLARVHQAKAPTTLSGRLVATTLITSALNANTRTEAFNLFASTYEGAERGRFERDLAEKQLVILLRDRATQELKGFSTLLIRDVVSNGSPATVIFSGDTVIDRRYWGQKVLQREFVRILTRHKLRSPAQPLYWFLISKGYRTYLLMANAFPRAIPRVDQPDIPELRVLLNSLACDRFGAQYDVSSGIVRYADAHERVRAELAPVDDTALGNRHVAFFVQRNPDHTAGDELACIAEVRLVDLVRVVSRIARVQLRNGTRAWVHNGRSQP